MRKGFSLLTAIVVIVMMAGITAAVMNTSGKIIKETTSQYRKEQAVLLAKSYTEYAILAIQGQNMPTNPCLRTITGVVNNIIPGSSGNANDGTGYRVTVRLQYVGLPQPIRDNCPNATELDRGGRGFSTTPNTSVLVDVNVRYRDVEQVDAGAPNRDINYNRRTLQRL